VAIYHCQVKPVGRGQGRSSTAAAAYRSCSVVRDERTGELHDYSRKRGVEHAEIVLSIDATKKDIQWARDRERLWNAAESAEARKDARVAREYEVALPHELPKAQRVELVRAYAQDLANRYQCAVDFAIHKPHRAGDERNYHAHILTTTRQVTATGLGAKTFIERSDTDRAKLGLRPGKDEITVVRERWAAAANKALEHANRKERVDHRSLDAQGIDRTPTRHKGPAISALEARGEKSIVVERMSAEEASARLAKAAEVGRILQVSRQLRASVIDLSADVARAREARHASSKAELVEKTKQEGLQVLKSHQAERQRLLEKARGAAKDVDETRREAREKWRALREREKDNAATPDTGRENERVKGVDRRPGKGRDGPDDDFSL
jgi:ATP-dependent exoDNAse (exonuclease V) alpha subunit